MAELLLGCGNRRQKKHVMVGCPENWTELVTLDHDPNCGADILHDLEQLPWPVDDNAFDEIHAYDVLEHLGAQGDYRAFFAHFGEVYRALKPDGLLVASVPAYDSVWAWGDPSHRRIINEGSLVFLDQAQYTAQVGRNAMTDFRWLWSGDFETVGAKTNGDQFIFALQAHKPSRGK